MQEEIRFYESLRDKKTKNTELRDGGAKDAAGECSFISEEQKKKGPEAQSRAAVDAEQVGVKQKQSRGAEAKQAGKDN